MLITRRLRMCKWVVFCDLWYLWEIEIFVYTKKCVNATLVSK